MSYFQNATINVIVPEGNVFGPDHSEKYLSPLGALK